MSLIWRRCFKFAAVRNRWMSTCRPQPPMANECHSQQLNRTMNDLRAPNSAWITRYFLDERSSKSFLWAGFGMGAITLATLVKSGNLWYVRNLQYIPDFDYDEIESDDDGSEPEEGEVVKTTKGDQPTKEVKPEIKVAEVENIIPNSSQSPFYIITSLVAIASVAKLFL